MPTVTGKLSSSYISSTHGVDGMCYDSGLFIIEFRKCIAQSNSHNGSAICCLKGRGDSVEPVL